MSRRQSHRDFLGSFGFTHKDRARIRAMAIRTRENGFKEVFEPWPLDTPYKALAVRPDLSELFSGQMIGVIEGCAIHVWPDRRGLFDGPVGMVQRPLERGRGPV